MFKRTEISAALAIAFGGVLAFTALPSMAQQEQPKQEEQKKDVEGAASVPPEKKLDRVTITGTNIRRTDAETASPVQVITKKDIEQSGKGTVAEYLQTLTSDGQGSVPFTYGRGFSGATSSGISLRGLGANATLVLINGRRVTSAVLADDAQRTYVDLNQIPLEAVERVEVLKDGASSIYGSDAVAGVVNIILRKNFSGTTVKATFGTSKYGDGNEPRAAITHGFGDMSSDGYNVLLNAEFGKKDAIYYRDRTDRGSVGVSAIGQPEWGFDPSQGPLNNIPRAGGNGTIPLGFNLTSPSIIGNVLNPNGEPKDNKYFSRGDGRDATGFINKFPGAQAYCLAHANLPQNDAGGGCIIDQRRLVNQIQPDHETASFYGRFSKQINADTEGFVEVGLYSTKSTVTGLALAPSGAYFTADGLSHSQTAATVLGANHPDNPYGSPAVGSGQAARLSYLPLFDTGTSDTRSEAKSSRVVAGLKGVWNGWDYDGALSFSEAKQTDTTGKAINWRVKNALLNPTDANVAAARAFSAAYAALPVGTVWRIGENAGLNSQAMYAALLQDQQREGFSRQYGADMKVSREVGELDGGPIGVAFGAEVRHEANELPLYTGLGDYIGLSLTSYGGKRDIAAVYGEALLPISKRFELNAALRYDDYSDAGGSLTPKIGAKLKALDNFALRGTLAKGFRAPSSTENSATSLAAFGGATVDDNARCAVLVADFIAAGKTPADAEKDAAKICKGIAPTFVQHGNPDLEPENSTSTTLGIVWDATPRTSITADLWQIKRSGMPVLEDTQAAVDAGRVARDPTTAATANDPGNILVGSVVFQNSSESLTRGLDIEIKQRWDLGVDGKVTAGLTWTRLLVQRVTDSTGTEHNYAGTHGNCEITNCMGSPKDRVSLATTWELAPYRLGANLNYRGSMSNEEEVGHGCAQTLSNGVNFPFGCKVRSFTTLDVSGAWSFGANTEVFGSIANLFDTVPPVDFLTYGAIGYNPLDYSGAIGRYFRVGVKHRF